MRASSKPEAVEWVMVGPACAAAMDGHWDALPSAFLRAFEEGGLRIGSGSVSIRGYLQTGEMVYAEVSSSGVLIFREDDSIVPLNYEEFEAMFDVDDEAPTAESPVVVNTAEPVPDRPHAAALVLADAIDLYRRTCGEVELRSTLKEHTKQLRKAMLR